MLVASDYAAINPEDSLFQVLNTLLDEWRKDETNKVLIFTKSVKLLDMLDYHLSLNRKPAFRTFHDENDMNRCLRLYFLQTRWNN